LTVDDHVDIATRPERRLMFDVGWTKLVLIAMVALIAIGPKELPGVLRNVGHWVGKIRRLAAEFQSQFQDAMREAEMADLRKHADDLNNAARLLTEQPHDATRRVSATVDKAESLQTASASTGGASESLVTAPTPISTPANHAQITRT
jgi:sec-independent protein translocase protein TatB